MSNLNEKKPSTPITLVCVEADQLVELADARTPAVCDVAKGHRSFAQQRTALEAMTVVIGDFVTNPSEFVLYCLIFAI